MFTEYPLLYEDSQLVLIDKPAGVLSHPNPGQSGKKGRCAFEGAYDPQARTFQTPDGPLWLLHRLDQDTSGVLLAARDADSAQKLRQAFEDGTVRKRYQTLVRGDPGVKGIWKDHLALRRDGSKARSLVLRGHPVNAELRFRRTQVMAAHRVSLLEVELLTGRTHQIRVQAQSRQHPVCGDDVYGDFAWNKKMHREFGSQRLFLHACRLEIRHPRTGRPVSIEAPLPPELNAVLTALSG